MKQKEGALASDKQDMLLEDWTGGVFDNIKHIKTALWLIVVMEVGRFFV